MSEHQDRLDRPDGTDPDGFSRRVADAYAALAATTTKPAKVIAEASGVPVATVHRWIREARLRRHLAPATRQGTSGPDRWTLVAAEIGTTSEKLRQAMAKHAPSGLRPTIVDMDGQR